MATTFTNAAVFDAGTDKISFGAGTLYDVSTFTVCVLLKPSSGGTRGNYIGRGLSWELNIDPAGTLYSKWYGTTTEDSGNGSAIVANSWNWVWVTWNGTVFGAKTGIYGSTPTSRTMARNQVGSGLTTAVGKSLIAGGDPSSHDGLFPNSIAFIGYWNTVLADGTIDSYSADMSGNGGLAAAIEYWKWTAADTTSITGGVAATAGTYTSITLGSGPDTSSPTITTNRVILSRNGGSPTILSPLGTSNSSAIIR